MKNAATLLVLILCFAGITRADDTKYTEAMKKNISQMDSLRSIGDMVDLANSFLRIADAEKSKWLPYYYVSYLYVITSYTDTVRSKKDGYLDEALKAIAIADSLQPNESEIYVLIGMINQARLQVDPMNRFMQYGQQMNENLEKAKTLDPKNPRPEYLMGMTTYYMPEQFGGGAKAAKPIFESSLKKFDEFVPKDELMPKWGKAQLEAFLKQIPQQ
jgi:tetratricopeptide (TPR) repeat protein